MGGRQLSPACRAVELAIAMEPTWASNLPGRHGEASQRVYLLNNFYKRIGSHWRIVGERRLEPGTSRTEDVLYRFVMVDPVLVRGTEVEI